MSIDVNQNLKALAATLDEIARVLFSTDEPIPGAGTRRDELIRARDQVLRAIDELERLRDQ